MNWNKWVSGERGKVLGAALFGLLVTVGFLLMPVLAGNPPVDIRRVDPSINFSNLLANLPQSGSVIQMDPGTYTVTPSISGVGFAGYPGWTRALNLFNRTNVSIIGVPGQTVIDGGDVIDNTNKLGTVLLMTNCMNIYFYGITFKGQFLTNYTLYTNNALWAGVEVFNCRNVTFQDCSFIDHFDHGLWDSANLAAVGPHSSNVVVRGGLVQNCGSWRTNLSIASDGSGIECTGWTIEGVTFRDNYRHVEPYDEVDGYPFQTTIIRNNRMIGSVDSAVYLIVSNAWDVVIEGNYIEQPRGYSRRGTNEIGGGCGVWMTGGQRPIIRNNTIRGYGAGVGIVASVDIYSPQIVGNSFEYQSNSVVGNAIYMGDASSAAMRIRGAYVANNSIRGAKQKAMYLFGVSDAVFADNRMIEPVTAGGFSCVHIQDAGAATCNSNQLWRGNTILRTTAPDANEGFLIDDAKTRLLRFENNLIQGYTPAYNSSGGDEVSILGPIRNYSFTVDFPSIGTAGQFTTNFTATGTRTNDAVNIMLPAQFVGTGSTTNVAIRAWGSNDVVYLQMINNDAVTAANPGSVRVRATVQQVEPY